MGTDRFLLGGIMPQVKTFTTPLKVFHTKEELEALDLMVNKFLDDSGAARLISVSDACTSDETGATIGLIRVVAYEE
jgi:hypothetical protein